MEAHRVETVLHQQCNCLIGKKTVLSAALRHDGHVLRQSADSYRQLVHRQRKRNAMRPD
jgi:hypothetical protein